MIVLRVGDFNAREQFRDSFCKTEDEEDDEEADEELLLEDEDAGYRCARSGPGSRDCIEGEGRVGAREG